MLFLANEFTHMSFKDRASFVDFEKGRFLLIYLNRFLMDAAPRVKKCLCEAILAG
jgi:hypothetical protein